MRTLRLGSKGEDVKTWQTFLSGVGFDIGQPDGSFGKRTLDATRAFQRAHSLGDDGVAGNQTLGLAMQLGLDLAPEDPPLPGGPTAGVTSLNDAWEGPPRPVDATWITAPDPRVNTTHVVGTLPVPNNPPPPVGWVYWKGPVPQHAQELASKVENTPGEFPLGSFVQALINIPTGTQLVAARVEWHNYQGATGKFGCFRGTSLFRPVA